LRREHPGSPLAAEIDLQIVKLLGAVGDHAASEREARSFAKKYPDNPKAKEVLEALRGHEH
jgi:hypothetical protein